MADLIFKTLTITNFKAFSGSHKIELARTPGLYYITGNNKLDPELGANGVGKSTIWDALTWVLWGRTGRDNRPGAAITPWFGKGKTEVQLHYQRNGEDHFIYRTRNPNSLRYSFDASDDDKEIQQEEIPKLIGMSEEMFRRTLVLGQFGTMFLDLRPEQQSQMFTEALGLDIWLKAIEVASASVKDADRNAQRTTAELDTNAVRRADLVTQIEEIQKRADLFDEDRRARIAKIKRGIETLETDLDKLAIVKKPEQIDDAELMRLRKTLSPLSTEFRLAERDLDETMRDLKEIEKQIADDQKQGKVKKCNACGQTISDAKHKDNLQQLLNKAKAVQSQMSNHRAEGEDLKKRSDVLLVKINAEESRLKNERVTFDQRLDAYNKFVREESSIKGELGRQRDDLRRAESETNQAKDQLAPLGKRRNTLRSESTELKEQLDRAQKESEQAKFWMDGFREIRLSVIDQTLIELEMAASRHASMLGLNDWGIKFDTERETTSGKVSQGFTVLLYPPGVDEPVKWESYSGGEIQRWQLATSFALSEVLLSRAGIAPNMEVLDEPTRGLSSVGVSDLLDHLHNRAVELGRVVFFVDHHSLDKGAFDGTLMIEKTKQGSSMRWL